MYWQKRFNREDPDAELLQIMRDIREDHKDYGYRRIHGELRKQGIKVNKKRVHRIVQKYGMQVTQNKVSSNIIWADGTNYKHLKA